MKGINHYFAIVAYDYIDWSDVGPEALNKLAEILETQTQHLNIKTINRIIDYAIKHEKTAATALLLDFKAKHFGTDQMPEL